MPSQLNESKNYTLIMNFDPVLGKIPVKLHKFSYYTNFHHCYRPRITTPHRLRDNHIVILSCDSMSIFYTIV